MKQCPHCGADLTDGTVSFCPKCRKKLTKKSSGKGKYAAKKNSDKAEKKKQKQSNRKASLRKKKKEEKIPEVMGEPVNDGYDGYYNDVLPPDQDRIHEGLDKDLIKNIVTLGIGVTVIIGLCIALLYVL